MISIRRLDRRHVLFVDRDDEAMFAICGGVASGGFHDHFHFH